MRAFIAVGAAAVLLSAVPASAQQGQKPTARCVAYQIAWEEAVADQRDAARRGDRNRMKALDRSIAELVRDMQREGNCPVPRVNPGR